MKPSIIFFLSIFLLITLPSKAQKKTKLQTSVQQIDAIFKKWHNPQEPGIATGIVNDGKIEHLRGYGSANLEQNLGVSPQTKFHYSGLLDQMIAFSILLLEEEGRLGLEDDVRKHISDFPDLGKTITISNLLNHTSGLPDMNPLKELFGWASDDAFMRKDALRTLGKFNQLQFEPGSEQDLNRFGFRLLEEVIANASGMSFITFMESRIFEGLGMENSIILGGKGTLVNQRADGYFPNKKGFIKADLKQDYTLPSIFYTTVEDVCLWARNFSRVKIGTKAIIKKMETPSFVNGSILEEQNASLYIGQHSYWDFRGTKKLYLISDKDGYACKLIRFPDQDLSVVVLANGGEYIGFMNNFVAEAYLENHFTPLTNIEHEEKEEVEKKTIAVTQNLKQYIGDYWQETDFYTRKILLKNDTLVYHRPESGRENKLIPTDHSGVFKMLFSWGEMDVRFVEKGGKKEIVTQVVNDAPYRFTKFTTEADWVKDLQQFTGKYRNETAGLEFELKLNEGKLYLLDVKGDMTLLSPRVEDTFQGGKMPFQCLVFSKNDKNELKEMSIFVDGLPSLKMGKKYSSSNNL